MFSIETEIESVISCLSSADGELSPEARSYLQNALRAALEQAKRIHQEGGATA